MLGCHGVDWQSHAPEARSREAKVTEDNIQVMAKVEDLAVKAQLKAQAKAEGPKKTESK